MIRTEPVAVARCRLLCLWGSASGEAILSNVTSTSDNKNKAVNSGSQGRLLLFMSAVRRNSSLFCITLDIFCFSMACSPPSPQTSHLFLWQSIADLHCSCLGRFELVHFFPLNQNMRQVRLPGSATFPTILWSSRLNDLEQKEWLWWLSRMTKSRPPGASDPD